MKRILAVTLIASCVLLSACMATSIGLIGGADGPTAILVSKGKENPEIKAKKEPIKMVNINGELYFELDQETEEKARCGVMDGSLTKTVGTFEIPKESGDANFKGAEGYQLGIQADTVEIPIDDDWEIFKKLVTNRDVLQYQYCYIVEGTLPNAKDDSEFLVMADTLDVTFEDASYQVFGADASQMKDIYVMPMADS